ncbi:MAG: hypothetical protein KDK76_06935 [Chlamydiia bacterium]|nr:hypothetical protein [Chlamydiia bacterium]
MTELTPLNPSNRPLTGPSLPSFWERLLIKIKFLFTNTSSMSQISEVFSRPHNYEHYINPRGIKANEIENENYKLFKETLVTNPTYINLQRQIKDLHEQITQNEKAWDAILGHLQKTTDPTERRKLFNDQNFLMGKRVDLQQHSERVTNEITRVKAQVAAQLSMSRIPRQSEISNKERESIEVYRSVADQVFDYANQNAGYTIGEVTALSLPLFLSDVEEDNIRSFLSVKREQSLINN